MRGIVQHIVSEVPGTCSVTGEGEFSLIVVASLVARRAGDGGAVPDRAERGKSGKSHDLNNSRGTCRCRMTDRVAE